MTRNLRTDLVVFALCAILCVPAASASAATILKLNLGGTGPDVGLSAGGVFSTSSDGQGLTTGDQNTAIEYTDFLNGLFVDIPTPIASFTLAGVTRTGAPSVGGGLIVQNFIGGSLQLYGPLNELLLNANLAESAVVGLDNGSGNGSFFNVTLGTATAGILLPYLVPGSIGINMPLTNVTTNGNLGFLVQGNVLQPFASDASANITANQAPIPEPASALLLLLAASLSAVSIRRRR